MSYRSGRLQHGSRNITLTVPRDGNRQFNDRSDTSHAVFGRGSDSYRSSSRGGRFQGGQLGRGRSQSQWNQHDDRSSNERRMPENHWRSGRIGANRSDRSRSRFRGRGGSRPHFRSNVSSDLLSSDASSDGNREKREWQYKARGGSGGRLNRRGFAQNRSGGTGGGSMWNKIAVIGGAMYDKEIVMKSIRAAVEDSFNPILYEVEGENLVFYLEENRSATDAIKNLSRRLALADGSRLSFYITSDIPPMRALTPEHVEALTSLLSERYSVQLKRLDLKHFHGDKRLLDRGLFLPLYQGPVMQKAVEVIVSHISYVEEIDLSCNLLTSLENLKPMVSACPALVRLNLESNKLHAIHCLGGIKGMHLLELTLSGNPLMLKSRSEESYISGVRQNFPHLKYLDSKELPKTIGFDVDEGGNGKMPPSRPGYSPGIEVAEMVDKFIQQYYEYYDTNQRQLLVDAYTEEAMFSLLLTDSGPSNRTASSYINKNRNLIRVPHPDSRERLLMKNRTEVIQMLIGMPQVTHDLGSFVRDITFCSESLVQVMLTGVFQQISVPNSTPWVVAFSRAFTIVRVGTGFCISNDQLTIVSPTPQQIMKTKEKFSAALLTSPKQPQISLPQVTVQSPPAVSGGQLSTLQLEMIEKFSVESNMLPEFSKECLESKNYNFQEAAAHFVTLQKSGQIPASCFRMMGSP